MIRLCFVEVIAETWATARSTTAVRSLYQSALVSQNEKIPLVASENQQLTSCTTEQLLANGEVKMLGAEAKHSESGKTTENSGTNNVFWIGALRRGEFYMFYVY